MFFVFDWKHIEVSFTNFKAQISNVLINPLTPKDPYSGRTAPLTSKRFILYIYSTNTSTEYFKHGIYCPFFSLQKAVCFIILTYLVPVLFTFYIQGVLKLKKNNSGAKRLKVSFLWVGNVPILKSFFSSHTSLLCILSAKNIRSKMTVIRGSKYWK